MLLIDVAFIELRPSPWRQAVDLANMMLCLALRSSPERVYQRALRQFSVQEISEGFAGARGEDEVPLTASCDAPAIGVSSSELTAGQTFYYRLTGADDTAYVVTVDGEPVRGDAGSTVSYTETDAGPSLELAQCLSPSLALAAPAGDGPHDLALLELPADGTTTTVARVTRGESPRPSISIRRSPPTPKRRVRASAATASARPPAARISSATASATAGSGRRPWTSTPVSLTQTAWPWPARARATARPMPRPPPVTMLAVVMSDPPPS